MGRKLHIDVFPEGNDPFSGGPSLMIGLSKHVGWVAYANGDEGYISFGKDIPGITDYYLEGTHCHWAPSSSEISVDQVEAAIVEFMTADGAKPTAVSWQPFDGLEAA